MGTFGIILSLAGLMYLAYRGINVLVLAPLMALLAASFDSTAPLLGSYTQIFMPALGSYLLKYFPLFLLGAIFGKLMGDSGAAEVIGESISKKIGAHRAALAIVLSCALLTYGGVSLFVVAFCIYPIAQSLFKQGKVPKRFIPASIALGSFTFTMTALPGTPAIQNAIPMPFFGTTAFAAPGLGLLAGLIMFGGGMIWLNRRIKSAQEKGEGYLLHGEIEVNPQQESSDSKRPNLWISLAPLLLVLILNFIFSKYIIPSWDTEYLSQEKFGGIPLKNVLGLWSIILGIFVSVLVLLALQWKYLKSPLESINQGTMGSLLPIFNTASEVGYGATVASLGAFTAIKDAVLGILPQYPLVSEAISINVLAGITGSASGGLSIALKALAENYLAMAEKVNLSPELLHRVASLACGGFDTLPHNGAVITLLTICGLTHKKSYFDIFMVAVVFPFIATISVVIVGSLLGNF